MKELGTFEGVGRDLRDAPYALDLDLAGVADGVYQIAIAVSNRSRPVGSTGLLVSIRQGLDQTVTKLEAAAARAPRRSAPTSSFPWIGCGT